MIGFAASPARAGGSVCPNATHTCTWDGNGTNAPSCQNISPTSAAIEIAKAADESQVVGEQVAFTLTVVKPGKTVVVTNAGPSTATDVTITDPMPGGNTFVSVTATQGTCSGGAILTCNLGDLAAGASVTITLVTTPSRPGTQTNTVTVSSSRPETNTGNNKASASVQVTGPLTPPKLCIAVSRVSPKQLFVGRKTHLTIHVTRGGKAVRGVHVRIKGPKVKIRTGASNRHGVIKRTLRIRKAGVLIFSPIASKACNTKRVGVTGVFTPPVTG